MRSLEGLCSKGWRVLAQPARLLLEHIDSVFVLHLQLRGCVCFINWLSVESESDLPHRQTLPLAVGLHQLAERRVPLDLELHDGAILPGHLQVDVVVLCLHSFLGLLLRHGGRHGPGGSGRGGEGPARALPFPRPRRRPAPWRSSCHPPLRT